MDVPKITTDCPGCKQQQAIIEQQQATIDALVEQVEKLTKRLEKVEREGKRQAAPFRKGRKADPNKPGRKSGEDHGRHHRRTAPEQIDETYDVPLPACCPDCGANQLTKTETRIQYQTEIPRTVIHRQFNIDAGICTGCGSAVQGRHELQTSDATGAAGVQLGPNIHAAMTLLNKELGLSHGKVKRLLEMLFEITVGRSTSCRSMFRTAKRLELAHQEVRRAVRGSPQLVGDETGWRVDGRPAWLHAFVGLTATCYEIDPTRSIEPAERLLGRDWSGIFGHDGWAVYDKFTKATHQQCLAHLLRRCESLIESGTGGALAFPRAVKELLLKGFEYRNRFHERELTAHGLKVMAGRLTMQMANLVRPVKTHAANERFAKFLEKHLDDLFTFLRYAGADATNWRGEQAIRPAVVNRKVWGGNRSEAGANAQSIIMSVMRTCDQRLADPFIFIRRQLTSQASLTLPLPIAVR
ncbi:IS66 family transposase [Roseiconus nitratireducens]|uniref:IS66 family transposase n=1 Tax=Roseiconus nitratireducens TaxID=2605748 RepID=A0A5M6CM30_9BACT|nr:IS66 family transposase [Roseiconus nitratireducens]KAA5534199.1 IS66 family transposase [Roseiconus nitratireducens]